MNNQTIADIYAENDKVREKFMETLVTLTDEQTFILPEGEKWTVAQIVEHVSKVDEGMARICGRLLSNAKAAGKASDGIAVISDNFRTKANEVADIKLEAPIKVHPTDGDTIANSLAKMEATGVKFDELRPLFETCDSNENKFPHPFFGDLSAVEWLTLVGSHKTRHLKQIKNVLNKIGQ